MVTLHAPLPSRGGLILRLSDPVYVNEDPTGGRLTKNQDVIAEYLPSAPDQPTRDKAMGVDGAHLHGLREWVRMPDDSFLIALKCTSLIYSEAL